MDDPLDQYMKGIEAQAVPQDVSGPLSNPGTRSKTRLDKNVLNERNMRFIAAQRMLREMDEYFSDRSIETRYPRLYYDLLGEFLTAQREEEAKARMNGIDLPVLEKAVSSRDQVPGVSSFQNAIDKASEGQGISNEPHPNAPKGSLGAALGNYSFSSMLMRAEDRQDSRMSREQGTAMNDSIASGVAALIDNGDEESRRALLLRVAVEKFVNGEDKNHFDYGKLSLDMFPELEHEIEADESEVYFSNIQEEDLCESVD